MLRISAAFLAILIGGHSVLASPVSEADFTSASALIDFESIADSELITSQFQTLGVVFSGGFYGDPFPGSTIKGNQEGTNFSSSSNIKNPIIANFSVLQQRAGAWMGQHTSGIGDIILLQAFRGGLLVDEHRFRAGPALPGGNISSVFAALEIESGFDRLEFSGTSGNLALSIDDFRFEAVPEPATITCVLLGIACCISRRRTSHPG